MYWFLCDKGMETMTQLVLVCRESLHCYVAMVTIETVELGMNYVTCNFRKRNKAKDFHGNKSV
jgi:hypothetical protein